MIAPIDSPAFTLEKECSKLWHEAMEKTAKVVPPAEEPIGLDRQLMLKLLDADGLVGRIIYRDLGKAPFHCVKRTPKMLAVIRRWRDWFKTEHPDLVFMRIAAKRNLVQGSKIWYLPRQALQELVDADCLLMDAIVAGEDFHGIRRSPAQAELIRKMQQLAKTSTDRSPAVSPHPSQPPAATFIDHQEDFAGWHGFMEAAFYALESSLSFLARGLRRLAAFFLRRGKRHGGRRNPAG